MLFTGIFVADFITKSDKAVQFTAVTPYDWALPFIEK